MQDKVFDIIRFTGGQQQYYGDTITMPELLLASGKYTPLSKMDIPLGQSRCGGPVVDLPPGIAYPEGMVFAAQVDLAQVSPHDISGLLPKRGQLIFFAGYKVDIVKVMYADVPNDQLVRTVKEHEDQFFSGVLINEFFAATEHLADRYRDVEYEDEREDANEDGKIWDDYKEGAKSKIFGIYTNNQWGEDEIMEVVESNSVVLLQVGEDMNDEGIFSVLIDRDDLKAGVFDNCTTSWSQS